MDLSPAVNSCRESQKKLISKYSEEMEFSKLFYVVFLMSLVEYTFCEYTLKLKRNRRLRDRVKRRDEECLENFCQTARDYPEEIKEVVRKQVTGKYNFQLNKFEKPQLKSGSENAQQICAVKSKIITPKTGRNINAELKFIIQDGNKYKQSLHVQICSGQFKEGLKIDCLPEGYQASCTQNFVTIPLNIYENDAIKQDFFSVPVGCSVEYSRTSNFS